MVSSNDDISSCVGGTFEDVEDLEIIVAGVRGGEIWWGILCRGGCLRTDASPDAYQEGYPEWNCAPISNANRELGYY